MNEEPIQVTLLVIEVLERLGVRYLLVGSLASSIYGEPRSTRDADILADIRSEHVEELVEALETQFNISKEAIENALRHKCSFNVIHYQSLFKVDVFVPKSQFDEQELRRRTARVLMESPEKHAYLATIEDVILSKLHGYRQGNEISEQQWRDVIGMFKAAQGQVDLDYLRQTAQQLGV